MNMFNIAEIFDISYEAAENIIKYLNRIQNKGVSIQSIYPQLTESFDHYIENLVLELKSYSR